MVYKAENLQPGGKNIISSIPFFSELSSDETSCIDRVLIKKRFQRNQIVLSEEDASSYMYFVYAGKVRVVKLNEDGREQIITIHKKGDFFGEMALLDGKTQPATVIAHEESLIGLLHKNDFEYHLMANEVIRRKIVDLLCNRLRDAWMMLKLLSFDCAEHRVMFALDQLHERYGVKDNRGVIINLRIKHQLIANYASVSRETATRILNRLQKSGEILFLDNKTFLLKDAFFKRLREIHASAHHPLDA